MNESTSPARPRALVTGGSRGVGRAVVTTLAREGWDVIFSYVSNEAAARETLRQAEALGARVIAVKADVGSEEDTRTLFRKAVSELGGVDALVNNAGIIGGQRPVLEADAAHIRSVLQTNVIGSFLCVAEAARIMSTQRGGRGGVIVNVGSAASRTGGPPLEAHYAASKGAIDSFTLALATELSPHGIRVNGVRPGLIETEIHAAHGGQAAIETVARTVPLGRAGSPEEVADLIAYLCGPKSSYVHGALIDIGGGR